MNLSFRTTQKAGSDLYGACTQREGCGDSTRVGNATRRNYRNVHCVDDRWDEREESNEISLGVGCLE